MNDRLTIVGSPKQGCKSPLIPGAALPELRFMHEMGSRPQHYFRDKDESGRWVCKCGAVSDRGGTIIA